MLSVEPEQSLAALGTRIREARIAREETQARFAVRLGVSVPTLRKLENGDPTVSLGLLAEALALLDRLADLDSLLAPKEDLFARWDLESRKSRRRVGPARKGAE